MTDLGTHQFSDALDLFLLDCEARRLTVATREFYRLKLSLFVRWCDEQGIKTLQQLTAHDLRRYLVSLSRRELSSQYQNNLARAIRAFLNYCVRDEPLAVSPFNKVQMPRLEKKILTALSSCDIQAILRGCSSERDKAMCLFLLDSGVRVSELVALNVADVATYFRPQLPAQRHEHLCVGTAHGPRRHHNLAAVSATDRGRLARGHARFGAVDNMMG